MTNIFQEGLGARFATLLLTRTVQKGVLFFRGLEPRTFSGFQRQTLSFCLAQERLCVADHLWITRSGTR